MKNGINMKNRTIETMSLLLILLLVVGCIESDKKTTETPITVSTTTEKIIEPTATIEKSIEEDTVTEKTVIPTISENESEYEFLAYTFKVNDKKIMFDRNIQLIDLATEEGIATVKVDGGSYKLTYNVEEEINGRRIKITDFDGIDQTVKIIVRYT